MCPKVDISVWEQHFYESTNYEFPAGSISVDRSWGWRIRLAAHLCTNFFEADNLETAQRMFDEALTFFRVEVTRGVAIE